MKQEDKDLLLQDLCAINDKVESLQGINILDNVAEYGSFLSSDIEEVKPYLFPLSSMTEEQKEEYNQSRLKDLRMLNSVLTERISDGNNFDSIVVAYNEIDWLNKNHFDYRGLIEKGLAIDCTNLNIY